MSDRLHILGIESSCDDTAVAIINSNGEILANIVINQNNEHQSYKGVVPEIAARSHILNIEKAFKSALAESGREISDIDMVAATTGPGLIGGVIVGAMFGMSLASTMNVPFIPINHLEGHALIPHLSSKLEFPYLLLLASGGHTQFIAVENLGQYKLLGQTYDDAIGEAFDKVAKMLDLGFPGGPIIEKMAINGDPNRFNFPKPIINNHGCNMSFSGLKTAVKITIDKMSNLRQQDKCDIAASFQNTIKQVLVKKTSQAILEFDKIYPLKQFVISGGVASNKVLRKALHDLCSCKGYEFYAPPIKLCTDNAVMIAYAALLRYQNGCINYDDYLPKARWSLEDLSNS